MDIHLDNIKINNEDLTRDEALSILDIIEDELVNRFGNVKFDDKVLTEEEHIDYCSDFLASHKVEPEMYTSWFQQWWYG